MHETFDELLSMNIQSSRQFASGRLYPAGDPCNGAKITVREGFSLFASFRKAQSPTDGSPAGARCLRNSRAGSTRDRHVEATKVETKVSAKFNRR